MDFISGTLWDCIPSEDCLEDGINVELDNVILRNVNNFFVHFVCEDDKLLAQSAPTLWSSSIQLSYHTIYQVRMQCIP